MFERFPYTNFHEQNDDWIIKTVSALEKDIEKFVKLEKIKYASPFEWDNLRTYEKNTLVKNNDFVYLSVKDVYKYVDIANEEYWLKVAQFVPDLDTPAKIIKVVNGVKNGLVNDGVTDNSELFTNIITSVEENSVISLDNGSFYIENPVAIRKPVTIKGNGDGTVIIVNNGGFIVESENVKIENIKFIPKKDCEFAIKVKSRYCKFYDLTINDTENYFFSASIIDGDTLTGSWFNNYKNITINKDITTKNMNGYGFHIIGAVNNLYESIFISRKNVALNMPEIVATDRPDPHYVDGVQLTNCNIVHCNYGMVCKHSSAIFVSNTIFDQLYKSGIDFDNCINARFTNCWFGFPGTVYDSTMCTLKTTFYSFFENCNFYCAAGRNCNGVISAGSQYLRFSKTLFSYFEKAIEVDAGSYGLTVSECTFNSNTRDVINNGTKCFVYDCFPVKEDTVGHNRFAVCEYEATSSSGNASFDIYVPVPFKSKPGVVIATAGSGNIPVNVTVDYGYNSEVAVHCWVNKIGGTFNGETFVIKFIMFEDVIGDSPVKG